jgi:hypothetical protein
MPPPMSSTTVALIRLLRELQLEAAGRVPQRRDLLLVEGGAGAGKTLAVHLQHHPSTLFAPLQTAGTGNVATREESRVWRSGKQSTLSTSPHPRRRRDTYKHRCATLRTQPAQKIGHSTRSDCWHVGSPQNIHVRHPMADLWI